MTYGGARGQTAIDMAKTLQFPFEGQRVHTAFADLIQQINQPGQKRPYQLSVANRLWGQKGYGFLPDFLMLTKEAYGAGLEEVDFSKATEQARQTINDWVAKETQNKIRDLIGKGVLNGDTRLVLTNAIYFKAPWEHAFGAKATLKEDFKASAAKSIKVDMMHQTENMKLLETDTFQMLSIPYQMHDLSMVILLPRQPDALAPLEKAVSAEKLQEWMGKMKMYQVALSLPKFTFTAQFTLNDVLSQMGMGIAFNPTQADFSGITTQQKLFLSAVIHKAFVAVDEKGTEAAAATAVGVRATAAPIANPPATFRADHPFLFLIRDNRTGSILFMGRVVNP
jgi:serpin B